MNALFIYSGGKKNGDFVEKVFADWAHDFVIKHKKRLKNWKIKEIPNANKNLLNKRNLKNVHFIALWGHGRKNDGSILDVNNCSILTRKDKDKLINKIIFGMFCHSLKLIKPIYYQKKDINIPATLSFNNELWLILNQNNRVFKGFKPVAQNALFDLLKYKNGTKSVYKYKKQCLDWSIFWLLNLHRSLINKDSNEATNSFLCVCAFLNNLEAVRSELDIMKYKLIKSSK
jgi:hypothetical protein